MKFSKSLTNNQLQIFKDVLFWKKHFGAKWSILHVQLRGMDFGIFFAFCTIVDDLALQRV